MTRHVAIVQCSRHSNKELIQLLATINPMTLQNLLHDLAIARLSATPSA